MRAERPSWRARTIGVGVPLLQGLAGLAETQWVLSPYQVTATIKRYTNVTKLAGVPDTSTS
jgi:hypothetical protein